MTDSSDTLAAVQVGRGPPRCLSCKNTSKCLNLLTEIRLRHYSCKMISEFHQLAEKIARLTELTHALRRENAELRMSVAGLTTENAELENRIEQAYQRVSALLEKMPAADAQNEEAA
jgi:cell division protein ZapB